MFIIFQCSFFLELTMSSQRKFSTHRGYFRLWAVYKFFVAKLLQEKPKHASTARRISTGLDNGVLSESLIVTLCRGLQSLWLR